MTEINTLLLLFFVEALLVCAVVLVTLIVLSVIRKGKDRAAVKELISRVNGDQERRLSETKGLIQKRFLVSDDSVDAVTNEIAREEKRFYQTLIHLYLKRDVAAVRGLNTTFEAAVAPYRNIEVKVPEPSRDEELVPDAQTGELEHLRQENERLKTELGVTMETMGRMLNEYAAMYGGGTGETGKTGKTGKTESEEKLMGSILAADDAPVYAAEQPELESAGREEPDESWERGEDDRHGDEPKSERSDPEPCAAADEAGGDQPPDEIDDGLDVIQEERPARNPDAVDLPPGGGIEDELEALDDDLDFVFELSTEDEKPESDQGDKKRAANDT